ncbi:MAG: hypothetical protein ACXAEU_24480 [Candidatus Hodarchaeales archaeon]|jgi:hypothetical protein
MTEPKIKYTTKDVLNAVDSFPSFHSTNEAVNHYSKLLDELLVKAGKTRESIYSDYHVEFLPVREDYADYLLVQVFDNEYRVSVVDIYDYITGDDEEHIAEGLASLVLSILQYEEKFTIKKLFEKLLSPVRGLKNRLITQPGKQ